MIDALTQKIRTAFSDIFKPNCLVVGRCGCDCVGDVMSFIENHWKHGHIMARDQELVDFMHKDVGNGDYHFIIGREDGKRDIVCFLGFIPTSQYDFELQRDQDVWLALWKSIGGPGSGLLLFEPIARHFNTISAIGINGQVAKVYKWLGFEIVQLKQFYLLNDGLKTFNIAWVGQKRAGQISVTDDDVRLVHLGESEIERMDLPVEWKPRKTARYVINRYLHHPIYRYQILVGSVNGTKIGDCIFVVRKVEANGSCCLRLVDIVGNLSTLPNLKNAWQKLLRSENAEYVDCFEFGLKENEVKIMGMDELDPSGDIIVPNYFEPYERRNVTITAAVMNPSHSRYVMFKGDSDQDRPSRR